METKKSPCAACPREVEHENKLESLEAVRSILIENAEQLMDDDAARELAVILNSAGINVDVSDAQSVRQLATTILDLLDTMEEKETGSRKEETQFCVGALRLRAKDSHTEYNVALCRSPKGVNSGSTEAAVVTRATLTK